MKLKTNIRFWRTIASLAVLSCALFQAQAATHTVLMQGSAFVPRFLTIDPGDTVTWVNRDAMTHTSTSGQTPTADGKWESGFMGLNDTFSHTFDESGTFPYFCIPHASFMTGSITVREAQPSDPVVAITSPANNTTLEAPGEVTITAEASVPGGTITMVEFLDGATSLGMDHEAPFTTTANLAAGTHTLTAKATSNAGATATSAPVVVTVNAPANTPVVAITAPANGATLSSPGPVTITADASVEGGTIVMVEFFDGTSALGMDMEAPFSIESTLAAGGHSLTAKATSNTGSTATSTAVTVTVNSGGTEIADPFPARLAKGDTTIELQTVAEGLVSPLGMAVPDDGSGRWFVYDQTGVIHLFTNGVRVEVPLLDITSRITTLGATYDERGLIGLAVHPNFAENPLIYTYTSEPTGGTADFSITPDTGTNNHQSVIAEWRLNPANPNEVDMASRREIMRIDQPQSNHNGGVMHFGPDGYLHIALGDGGAADDQGSGHSEGGNGQDLSKILGKMIRIDVDGRTSANGQYAIPTDNPFVEGEGLDEIYAYGFRNPFAWSFDRMNGEMYVADVGQNKVEELDRVFRGGNYGWPVKEGSFYFDPNGDAAGFITTVPVREVPADLVDPIAEYDHDEGLAIVGGYVYHGSALPHLTGRYVTGDFGRFDAPAGRLFYLDRSEFKEFRIGLDDRALGLWIKGFGQDANGELYVFASSERGPSGAGGRILKIVPPANNLTVTEVGHEGGNVVLAWTGGVGPFLVQARDSAVEGAWMTVAASAQRTATVVAEGATSFYRVTDMAGNGPIPFTSFLSGENERPAVTTTGGGTGTFSLEGNTLHFDIRYTNLKSAATLAHIHGPATAAQSTNVLINLAPYNGGAFGTSGTLSGSISLTPEQKAVILDGRGYVNIHTTNHPGGEIRGHVAPVLYKASLSGGSERPVVQTDGEGSALLLLAGNRLSFSIDYANLSSAATLGHIHGPATTEETAPPMVDLQPFNGGAFGTNGTFTGTVELNAEQLAAVIDGLTYVNVHSAQHGGGEIRGQVLPASSAIPLSASLSGAAERPAVESPGSGLAIFSLEGNKLQFNITYRGLSGTATMAHIHGPARASESTGVLIDLVPFNGGSFGTNGTLNGTITITDSQRAAILEGLTYVNVHSSTVGSGEVRGQIVPVSLQTTLLGASERNSAVQTPARGHATMALVGNELMLNVTYANLKQAATMAHIHGPSPSSGATGILIDLVPLNGGSWGITGGLAGTVTLDAAKIAAIIDGLTYVNVHSGAHGGGEIRGQISR